MDENLQEQNPFDENTQNLDDPMAVTSPSGFLNVNTDDPNPTSDYYKRVFNTIFELTDDELAKIEDHLKDKIQSHGEIFLQKYDNLQANYEKFKIECEQRFIELESEYTECQNKLSFESKNAHLYQTKSTENEDKVVNLTKQNNQLENEKEILASNQQCLNTVNQNLEAEKRDLLSSLDKKNKENDRLNEEWKSINVKLSDSESKICEITAQLEEIRSRESTIGFKEKQFKADKEMLLNEIDLLNQQLKDKSMQLLDSKGNSNQKIYDLESKIKLYSAENHTNKKLMDALQNENHSMETQIDELTKKLQEIREKDIKLKLEFNDEAMQRDKLIDMYKEENSNFKIRLEDAANAIKELNQMISEAKEENSKLADEKNFNEISYEAEIKEKDETIYNLEQELKNANELLSIAKRKGASEFFTSTPGVDRTRSQSSEQNQSAIKMNTLNETVSELRNNLSEANLKYENLSRDFEAQKKASETEKKQEMDKIRQEFEVQKTQVVAEQQKNYETLKADKTEREEIFITLVNELKDVVSTVSKEFELKDVAWAGAEGSLADRVRVVKEEIIQIKKLILDKIRNNRDQSSRIELDLLKNNLLHSQNDNEKLKKNLEAAKQTIADAYTKINTLTSSSSITSPITSQNTQETDASQQPPTAYIAPSRITNKPTQPSQQTVQNIAGLRRTAAVKPTPHINQSSTEQWTQLQEQSDPDETRSVHPHESQNTAPSTSRDIDSGSVNKRTREEDNVEESSEQTPSSSNSKKQKNSNENVNVVNEVFVACSSSQSDLQEQNSEFASSSQDQENQYILINDGEDSEVQELENNEEIVDTAGSDGHEDVIIIKETKPIAISILSANKNT